MQFDAQIQHWVNRVGFLIRKRLAQDFAAAGIDATAEEWAMLMLVQAGDAVTVTDLSERSFRDRTTVTRMVDRLVAKGLIARRPDPADRRVQRLALTEAGQARFARMAEIAERLIARSERGVPPDEVRRAAAVLARMSGNLATETEEEEDHGL